MSTSSGCCQGGTRIRAPDGYVVVLTVRLERKWLAHLYVLQNPAPGAASVCFDGLHLTVKLFEVKMDLNVAFV